MALQFQLTQKLAHGFQAFWDRYPNRTAKKDAAKAFTQVVKTPDIEAEIHAALDWQIPHWQTLEWYHPPYPATYLRQERFRDEKPKPTTTTPNRATAKVLTPQVQQQQDASARIVALMQAGLTLEEAKRQVGIEMGWIKE